MQTHSTLKRRTGSFIVAGTKKPSLVARKQSIPDRVRSGRSSIVPYRSGESFKARHFRRLAANLQHEAKLRQWCQQNGLALRITNEGHHWQVTEGRFVAEWWPSSAKLVINKRWREGIHCHDYKQAIETIQKAYRAQQPNGTE